MDILTSLGITKDTLADLIINIASIIVLYVVVKKIAYKPIKKFMDARTERLNLQRTEAEKLNEEASKKIEEYNALISDGESAKAQIIADGEEIAHKESEMIISEAKQTAAEIIRKANIKAEEHYKKTMEEAEDHIIGLSMEASSVLLKRTVNDEDNRKIVEEFLRTINGDKNA
jgi:F-type H+-transporting ATPase subunit b